MASGTVKAVVHSKNNAGFHNCIYRGKYLGSSVDSSVWAVIQAGTFDDLFIGDYWTIGNVNWRIAAFDYWINPLAGKTDHHVVIVPDNSLATGRYHNTSVGGIGYVGSDFRTGNNGNTLRSTSITAINNAFGSDHIFTYKDYLSTSTTSHTWSDCTVEMMSERMVYGTLIYGLQGNGGGNSVLSTSNSQFPLFIHEPNRITSGEAYWLRDLTIYSYNVCNVDAYGGGGSRGANDTGRTVRPCFAIYQAST